MNFGIETCLNQLTKIENLMSYIGGLTKAQFAAFLQEEFIKPLKEEVKSMKEEMDILKKELQQKNKELYTIEDLEALFNVSRATIHNWINDKKLVKHKIGGRTFFKREDIDRIIELSKEK